MTKVKSEEMMYSGIKYEYFQFYYNLVKALFGKTKLAGCGNRSSHHHPPGRIARFGRASPLIDRLKISSQTFRDWLSYISSLDLSIKEPNTYARMISLDKSFGS